MQTEASAGKRPLRTADLIPQKKIEETTSKPDDMSGSTEQEIKPIPSTSLNEACDSYSWNEQTNEGIVTTTAFYEQKRPSEKARTSVGYQPSRRPSDCSSIDELSDSSQQGFKLDMSNYESTAYPTNTEGHLSALLGLSDQESDIDQKDTDVKPDSSGLIRQLESSSVKEKTIIIQKSQDRPAILQRMLKTEESHMTLLAGLMSKLSDMKSPKQIKKVNELKCVIADLHDLQTNFVQKLRALQPFADNSSQEVGDVFRCMIQRQNYLCMYHKRLPPILDMCSVTSTKIAGDVNKKGAQDDLSSFRQFLQEPLNWVVESVENIKQLCAATPAHNPDLHKLEMLYETLMTESIELNAVIHAYGRGIVSSDIRKLRMHSMVVELVNPQTDERKLRYLLLFSDILVCAKIVRKDSIKQKNSVINERLKSIRHKEKSSQSIRNLSSQRLHSKSPDLLENSDRGDPAVRLETKWMIPLNQLGICLNQRVDYDNLKMSEQERKIEQIKFSISTFRSGKRHLAEEGSSVRLRRLEHSITKLEGRLVLQTPQLILPISDNSGQVRQILLVTERERNHWRTALETAVYQVKEGLASKSSNNTSCGVLVSTFDGISEKRTNAEQCSPRTTHSEMNELLKKYQYLIRLNKTGMALLKDHGVPGITGILRTTVHGIQGLNELDSYHVWIEVDSYAQFEELARTRVVAHQPNPEWNQTFDLQIDEAHRICFTIYRHCDVFAELEVKLTEDCICNKVISMPLKTKEATPRTITFTFSLSLCKPCEVRNRSVTTKHGRVFGHPLPDLVRRDYGEQFNKSPSDPKTHNDSNKSKNIRVPKIVVACTDEIERRGLREVGIYRVCGSNNDIQAIKELIDQDLEEGIKRLPCVEIFVVASLLKQFFRELPESLLTGPGSIALMQTAENPNEENRILQMKTIINSLPGVNKETFVHLVMHLLTVNRYKEVNMMDLSNLALLWSTALFQTVTRHQSMERTPANLFDSLNQEAAVSFQQTKTLHIILQAVQDNFLAFEESVKTRDI